MRDRGEGAGHDDQFGIINRHRSHQGGSDALHQSANAPQGDLVSRASLAHGAPQGVRPLAELPQPAGTVLRGHTGICRQVTSHPVGTVPETTAVHDAERRTPTGLQQKNVIVAGRCSPAALRVYGSTHVIDNEAPGPQKRLEALKGTCTVPRGDCRTLHQSSVFLNETTDGEHSRPALRPSQRLLDDLSGSNVTLIVLPPGGKTNFGLREFFTI